MDHFCYPYTQSLWTLWQEEQILSISWQCCALSEDSLHAYLAAGDDTSHEIFPAPAWQMFIWAVNASSDDISRTSKLRPSTSTSLLCWHSMSWRSDDDEEPFLLYTCWVGIFSLHLAFCFFLIIIILRHACGHEAYFSPTYKLWVHQCKCFPVRVYSNEELVLQISKL